MLIINMSSPVISFTPLAVSDLEVWYDFDDIDTLFQDSLLSTPVTTNGDTIGSVSDKSGNGYGLQQTVGADRPPWATGVSPNGKDAVDMTSDRDDGFGINTVSSSGGFPITMFWAAQQPTTIQSNLFDDTVNPRFIFQSDLTALPNTKWRYATVNPSVDLYTLATGPNDDGGDWVVWTTTVNTSGDVAVRKNGAALESDTGVLDGTISTVWSTSTTFLFDANLAQNWNAYFGEFLLYTRTLTSNEIDDVEDYLTDKWGTT